MTELYHFACRHSAHGIGRYGIIVPNFHPVLLVKLAWFTDRPDLDREALGLTSHTLACDRMEYLYRTENATSCVPFLEWAKATGNPFVGKIVGEASRPEHWFVSMYSVPVRRLWDKEKQERTEVLSSSIREENI